VEGSRRFRLPEFLDNRHTNEARLSILRPGSLYPQKIILVLISVRGCVEPRALVRPEVLGQRNIPMTPSGIEPANFQVVAQCLHQLLYRIPLFNGYRFPFPCVNWPEHEVNYLLPSGAEVKKEKNYISSRPICLHSLYKENSALFPSARPFQFIIHKPKYIS
jgi:hypothetical protein